MSDLKAVLLRLGLRHTAETIDDLIAQATQKRLGPSALLELLVEREQRDRARRSLERRMARSRLGRFRAMADFDWAWPKQVDRERIESALRLEFLDQTRNVVLVAPQGLGKTMIARNVAHAAVCAGHSVLFTTASELLLDLGAQDSARGLARRLKHYGSAKLLCIDEMGYLSYDTRNADLLFQLIAERYERRSVLLTTNLAFSDWPTIFPNASCATALIDRVIHHADVITIAGDSYRLREAEAHKAGGKRRSPKPSAE